jgi:hypothetical protein
LLLSMLLWSGGTDDSAKALQWALENVYRKGMQLVICRLSGLY